MLCFWCDGPGPLTRDHVKPRVAGGLDHGNIVMACQSCQGSRAVIQSFYGSVKSLRRKLLAAERDEPDRKRKRRIRHHRKALLKRRRAVAMLVSRWADLERTRWGSSPSAALDLTVPDLPKGLQP